MISKKFAKKAAHALGITEEYLLGTTSEPYLDETSDMIRWNKQQFLFLPLQTLLRNMGLTITPTIYVDEDKFEFDGKRWIGNRVLDEEEMKQYIHVSRNSSTKYGVLISADNEEFTFMEHAEFLIWQKNIINQVGAAIQKDIPSIKTPIIGVTVDDDIKRIIDGNEPLKWE